MGKEIIIGFDCREMWLPGVEHWTQESQKSLLRRNVKKLLSINRLNWPSVFIFQPHKMGGEWIGTATGYHLRIPEQYMTPEGFWNNLSMMQIFMNRNEEEYQRQCWLIAITALEPDNMADSMFSKMPAPVDPFHPIDEEWELLGYDVQDSGPTFSSGLSLGVYADQVQESLQEKWGKHLNEYHLFGNQEYAHSFASWKNTFESGIAPFFIYGLYKVQISP